MYTAIQSAIAVDFTLYKIKLLLLLLLRSLYVCIACVKINNEDFVMLSILTNSYYFTSG